VGIELVSGLLGELYEVQVRAAIEPLSTAFGLAWLLPW
jgi:hypothetical protein